MKYKDFKAKPTYRTEYKWYLMDDMAGEFLCCDKCRAVVPVHLFTDWMHGRWLCSLCANATELNEQTKQHANYAANMALLALKVFDDVEIEKWDEDKELI